MAMLARRSAVRSAVGVRENNEDAAYASSRLAAVADGVGGAAAGEVASRLAILKMQGLDKRRIVGPLREELVAAVTDANDVIGFAMTYDPAHAGMGTTLTAVALDNDSTYLTANVGDSRSYLLRDGRLRRLTRDDSLVQELIDRGAISEAQARSHPQRSVVLAALDGTERSAPRLRCLTAREGDRLILCSDGVSDYLDDEAIANLIAVHDVDESASQLVNAALDRGSRDNVTAVVADVIRRSSERDGWLPALSAADVA